MNALGTRSLDERRTRNRLGQARAGIGLVVLTLLAGCSSGHTAAPTTTVGATSTTAQSTAPNITTPADTTIEPKVIVAPDTGLMDGQVVTVTVTGFGVGGEVRLSECASAVYANRLGCGPQSAQQTLLVTNNSRAGVGYFVVHTRASTAADDLTHLRSCASACVLVATAGAFAGYPNAENYADTRIRFSPVSYPPCKARQITALAPQWLSPLSGQNDLLLRFKNAGAACDLTSYALVARKAGQPDVASQPVIPGPANWDARSIALPSGATAQIVVVAIHACLTSTTQRYNRLRVTMPGGGTLTVTLPQDNPSPDPAQHGQNLTLPVSTSCPPYVGHYQYPGAH